MLIYDANGNQRYVFTAAQLKLIKECGYGRISRSLSFDLPKKMTCPYCDTTFYSIRDTNKCPNCGAPMREKQVEMQYMYDGIPVQIVSEEDYKILEAERNGTETDKN